MLRRKLLPTVLPTLLLASISFMAQAADMNSPLGQWRTIDDETGKPKSIVTITADDKGTLSGQVTLILDPAKRQKVCEACKGELHNQPIQGLTIIRNMHGTDGKYEDGTILDPESGKEYSATMKLKDKGQKLEVRGFIGFSLLGRSQTWERVESNLSNG
ncbi:DUF2147 domain-containing protein [Endozoicomonadaceae bacterium StTr2]